MPRYWREMSHNLAYCACLKAFDGKWRRNDILTHIEEWTGHAREELLEDENRRGSLSFGMKYGILEECAMALEDMTEGIRHGVDPDLDAVTVTDRVDGASGKVRKVAYLCVRHQLLGHLVKLGIEPLLHARILQTQHASIPGRGQTGLRRQVQRMLNRRLGIRCCQKTDCTSAYASVKYAAVLRILEEEIPRAGWILRCMRVLQRAAPGGSLIIGGYLDAWLFNLVMSYGMRYVLSLSRSRRGNRCPLIIQAESFMDDLLLMARSVTAIRQAVKQLAGFLWDKFRMMLRTTTEIIRIDELQNLKQRKRPQHPAGTHIDMGGFRIQRTGATIRRRNWRRARRCVLRAWATLRRTGALKRQQAGQIISRNGILKNTDSLRACRKYHVFALMRAARRVQAYWERVKQRKRRERVKNAVEKYRKQCAALCGAD